ncbi:MAG: hypothetical protein ACFE75_05700, partial [Candidatus Hodarchaeota archaeon]
MIRKTYIKRRKYCYILSFILLFNFISIILLPNISINVKNNEKLIDDQNSLIQTSSSSLPNRHYFKYYKVIIIDHSKVSGTGS